MCLTDSFIYHMKRYDKKIDGGFYWNAAEGTLRYTLPLNLVEVPAESKDYMKAG